jgi:hypothetical protein
MGGIGALRETDTILSKRVFLSSELVGILTMITIGDAFTLLTPILVPIAAMCAVVLLWFFG